MVDHGRIYATETQLVHSLKQIMNLYSSTGLIIQTILMDVKFDKIPKLPEAVINTNTALKFVAEIEHCTKLVKER